MAAVSSFLSLFLLSILAMPLPVGVPPLPEDPALLRVAPRGTMVYIEWFGTAEPDPNSRNKTEALLAETEVQQMLRGIVSAIRSSAEREAGGNEIVGELFDLGMLALRRPGCFFLSRLDLPPKPLSIQAGLVINLGEEAQNVNLTLRKMESLMVGNFPAGLPIETRNPAPVDGVQFRSLPMASGPMAAGAHASVISKSAMTPSLMGRIAVIEPGVRPSISLASWPTARTLCPRPCFSSTTATTDGSEQTSPLPLL